MLPIWASIAQHALHEFKSAKLTINYALSPSVVAAGQGSESLLTSSIPNSELQPFVLYVDEL